MRLTRSGPCSRCRRVLWPASESCEPRTALTRIGRRPIVDALWSRPRVWWARAVARYCHCEPWFKLLMLIAVPRTERRARRLAARDVASSSAGAPGSIAWA